MEPIEWSPTEAISYGWERVKADPAGLIGPLFVATLIQGVPNGIFGTIAGGLEQNEMFVAGGGVRLVSLIVGTLISAWLAGGVVTLLLKVVRDQEYALSDIFGGGRYFVPMLITLVIVQFGTTVGMMLCFIPGIILALGLGLAVPLVVERDMAPVDAIKESWRLTDGHKLNLFVFWLLAFVLSIAGMMACCVGILPVMAIIAVGQMQIYDRLMGQEVPPAQQGPTTF